jgi:3' terminal RNA ribose 2'-O-methyltransferase Hen1
MLLTITTTHQPATDLGYLLHKNPARVHDFDLPFGKAHVFYPEATAERCTAALLLDIDPVGLVRGAGRAEGLLDQYVNDRPYASTSFLSVAMVRIFGTALGGRSKDRPELVTVPLPLELTISGLPCRGGEPFLRALFEPLGYEVMAERHALDPSMPSWGDSRYFTVTLRAAVTLHDALSHVYVLVPVLDAEKHYWVGEDEIEKLLRHGEGWLSAHPEREQIARRYLKNRGRLVKEALKRLTQEEEPEPDEKEERHASEEAAIEKKISLNETRLSTVVEALKTRGATTVVDLGCGEGNLLRQLLREKSFTRILGMDVSSRALEIASDRLRMEDLPKMVSERIQLIQGSLMYRDRRLEGFDAATIIEVIEHLDAPRLAAFERVVFGYARPGFAVVTTPNVEYNIRFETLPAGRFRHRDHRFEWSRAEFQAWADRVAAEHTYGVEYFAVGPDDPEVGPPTQMAIFTRGTP